MSCVLVINDNYIYDSYYQSFFYKIIEDTIEILTDKFSEVILKFLNNFSYTIDSKRYKQVQSFDVKEYTKTTYTSNLSVYDCICNNDIWDYKDIIVLTFDLENIEKLEEIDNIKIFLFDFDNTKKYRYSFNENKVKSYNNFTRKINYKIIDKHGYKSLIDYYINSNLN